MGARRIAIELAGEDVGSRVVVRPGRAWPVGGLGIGAGHAVPLHDPVAVRLLQRGGEQRGLDKPAVDKKELAAPGAMAAEGLSDKEVKIKDAWVVTYALLGLASPNRLSAEVSVLPSASQHGF